MPPTAGRRALLAGLVLAALAAGTLLLLPRGPRYRKEGPLHCIVDGGVLYTFDAAWRVETVRGTDPATGLRTVILKPPPERLEALRGALLRHLDLPSLERIPAEQKTDLDATRALGYL